jgi:hypothetical protein
MPKPVCEKGKKQPNSVHDRELQAWMWIVVIVEPQKERF